MTRATDMLGATSNSFTINGATLASCVEACFTCAQSCSTCADACLAAMPHEMRQCIARCTNCADICMTTGRVLSRPSQGTNSTGLIRALVQTCLESSRLCLSECASHSDMQSCQLCAENCRSTEQACTELLRALEVAA